MGGVKTLCIRSTVSASNEPLHGRAPRIAVLSGPASSGVANRCFGKDGGGGGERGEVCTLTESSMPVNGSVVPDKVGTKWDWHFDGYRDFAQFTSALTTLCRFPVQDRSSHRSRVLIDTDS